ncbi:MAG: sugar phosphate isomerase/epimerase family protein [Anaerolineaceae bacterium]
MKYAISNWIYGDEPIEETFLRLQAHGYEGIELVGEPDRYNVSEIKRYCDIYNIRVSSILSWCLTDIPGRDAAHPDKAIRKQAVDYLKYCIDLAVSVGAPIVVVLPAPAGRLAPVGGALTESEWDKTYRTEWENAVNSIREAANYASTKSITLAIEPLNRYESFLVTNLTQAKKFIIDVSVDNLKIHLDTFHMNIEENDLAKIILDAGDLLVNMHVSDSNRETAGRGHTDFRRILESLRKIPYQGYLVLEPVPPGSNPSFDSSRNSALRLREIYAKEGIDFLRKIEVEIEDEN